jgi:hypothetical protein
LTFSYDSSFAVKFGYYHPNQPASEVLLFSSISADYIYVHDDFDPDFIENDIALIELPGAVPFSGKL